PTTHNLRQRPQSRTTSMDRPDEDKPHQRKRKAIGGLRIGNGVGASLNPTSSTVRRLESDSRVFPQRKKRATDNHVMQPSTLAKYINGVWESLFSGIKLDPAEVIDQWQSVQSNGQPQLLTDADREVAYREVTAVQGLFGRMNILTRKISQTSRTCRSLEVIVQAFWVQCFDDRVQELTILSPREKAKKAAISEACIDFNWSEKELRNKMAIWRGYHDIRKSGGWAALVFAGMGLYRFCKYRVSFTDDTFQALQTLKPRFEVAADTLHPKWRQLLSIVGITGERKYHGHPHDWVVCGPGNEPIPLARTYLQWDKNFEYAHLEESTIDEDAWGLYDPRMVFPLTSDNTATCQVCGECQSDDPKHNCCHCFSSLYGGASASSLPVQVYWTQNGKNNGLLACLAIERGGAVGEFVGQITSGVRNKDVMVGETDKATYQIWQGRQGNHTRFVNHSCQPNSQFERFVWLGTQRIVLVSKGIEAGEEITVDYSDTYWKDLDKECLCGQAKCRYRRR
ncbi:SET domain-containing protein, partial [Polychaeton citri CBS 116435]